MERVTVFAQDSLRITIDPGGAHTREQLDTADAPAVLTAIDTARAAAWEHAGEHAPDHDITAASPIWGHLPLAGDIDLDATLVIG
ncbi:hypothetical protein J7E74_13665 [Rhodococcus erythropolis]|nr:hypothetical protein [Rhodococcus erythropolis]